jgi:hypothetical protein
MLFLSMILAASVSLAGERGDALEAFFGALEGHWQGKGTRQVMAYDGRTYTEGFRTEVWVDHDRSQQVWNSRNQLSTDSGQLDSGYGAYAVRGDVLFVGADPMLVLEASPTVLEFRGQRADWATGAVLEFEHRYEITGYKTLQGVDRLRRNGVVLQEDSYQLTKW